MKFLKIAKIFTFCFFANSLIYAVNARLAYSDLISDDLREFLYNDVISLDKSFSADIRNMSVLKSGSLPMIEEFLSDQLDICVLALPENSDIRALEDDNIVMIPFGYKSSVVVVNAENPISEITINQLARIFGESSGSANLLDWRDFGFPSFSTSSIKAYATKEINGISSDLFSYIVLNDGQLSSSVSLVLEEDTELMILEDKAGIGILPNLPENDNLKVLFLANDENSIAYGPSIDNVYYSDYPIRLPFYIVYRLEQTEKLSPLINILLSDEVSDIISKNNFFPLPKVVREKLIFDMQLYLQESKN